MNRLALAAALAAGFTVSTAKAEDFYESRLRIGEQALSSGRNAEAADNLRVASFGLLEKPSLLLEALVSLAVAQTRAGRTADAGATLQRFEAARPLVPSSAEMKIAPDVRAAFETLAHRKISAAGASAEASKRPASGSESK